MGLFGSSDDSGSDGSEDDGESPASGDGKAETERTASRVDDIVEDVRDREGRAGSDPVEEAVDLLDGSPEDRAVGARALARIAREESDAVDPVVAEVVDRLTERDLAGPIAEKLLDGAKSLHENGVGYDAVATGALDALGEALGRIEEVRTGPDRVAGGGASEIALAGHLREYAGSVDGRAQLTVEATADALEAAPRVLALRAGRDPIDTLVEMRTAHDVGDGPLGVDQSRQALQDADDPAMGLDETEFRLRVTDGVALACVVCCTRGTASQLETLTGHRPGQ